MNSDPVDSSVSYAYNKAGQLLNGTGSGFGSVSQFTSTALPIKYRAWGAVKQINYGNGLKYDHTYNARLQLTRRTFTPVSTAASVNDYAYYPDGRLKSKLLFSTPTYFDRSYSYDHVGRLTQARTDGEARGQTGSGPYHQDYVYDVWNNLGRTNNTLWGYPQPTDAPTYTNNRHPGMFYDNAGNVTASGGISHTYDAASRQTYASGGGVVGGPPPQPIYPVWEIANTYDGNGQYVKRAELRRYPNPSGVTTTNYYVRSSVLGGAILVELNAQGNKAKSYVYAAGDRLAKHEPASAVAPVAWYIIEPLTGDWGEAKSNGDFMGDKGANLDPLGADTPPNDPYLLDPTPTYIESRPNEPLYIDGGDPFDLSGGCTLDGVPVSCNFAAQLEQSETAAYIPYGQATRFNPKTGGYETFSAFADGRQGFVPVGGLGDLNAAYPADANGRRTGPNFYDGSALSRGSAFPVLSSIGGGSLSRFQQRQGGQQSGGQGQKKVAWVTLVTPCGQPTWEQVTGPDGIFNQLLKPLGVEQTWTGARFVYKQTTTRSYGEFITIAKKLGWDGFSTDPHYKHWGDDDFRKQYNGEWYHLSVKRPIDSLPGAGNRYVIDPTAPPLDFSIHWEEARPGSWGHFVNFISSTVTRTPIEQYRGLPPCK